MSGIMAQGIPPTELRLIASGPKVDVSGGSALPIHGEALPGGGLPVDADPESGYRPVGVE